MEKYIPFVRLSDGETWVEMHHPNITEEDFQSPEECHRWLNNFYPDRVRPDVFHGLQPIVIMRVR